MFKGLFDVNFHNVICENYLCVSILNPYCEIRPGVTFDLDLQRFDGKWMYFVQSLEKDGMLFRNFWGFGDFKDILKIKSSENKNLPKVFFWFSDKVTVQLLFTSSQYDKQFFPSYYFRIFPHKYLNRYFKNIPVYYLV